MTMNLSDAFAVMLGPCPDPADECWYRERGPIALGHVCAAHRGAHAIVTAAMRDDGVFDPDPIDKGLVP